MGIFFHFDPEPARSAALIIAVWSILLPAALTPFAQNSASARQLTIDRVEPPNWWVGMERHHVELMVYGENLTGAEAKFSRPGPRVLETLFPDNPNYAFVEIEIPDGLPPGDYVLELTLNGNVASVRFPILARSQDATGPRGFSSDDVVYLITPDRFANGTTANDRVDGILDDFDPAQTGKRHGGDLSGIIRHLDYLQDLGVTALWLNPVLENNGVNSYHGYKTTNLYRIDPRFGSNETYREFVQEAHRTGLKVIFDHINNHIGIRHPWIQSLPFPDWLNGTVADHLSASHFKLAITDPHADPVSVERLRTFWFTDSMPDLNLKSSHLARYRIQNTIWWIEYAGIDGIREDTWPYSDPDFLADWAGAVIEEYPDFNIVGELSEGESGYLAMFQTGSLLPDAPRTNLPTVMDFALTGAFRAYLSGTGNLAGIYRVFTQDFLYTDPSRLLTFFDNHDMTRGIFLTDGDPTRLLQVLTILLTARGIPQLLYGTEIGMRGGSSDPEIREDFPGGFPGDQKNAFVREQRSAAENAMFDFTQRLLTLRHDHPALRRGRMIHYAPSWNSDIYRYIRSLDEETILVLINGEDDSRLADLGELAVRYPDPVSATDLLSGKTWTFRTSKGLRVGPRGIRIIAFNPPVSE